MLLKVLLLALLSMPSTVPDANPKIADTVTSDKI
jgi:hypothetical protein